MEKIAVYGSGTIGSCEATLIIGHGIPCTVIGHSERGLERCRKAVAQNWDDLIANGLASEDNKAAALELLTVTKTLATDASDAVAAPVLQYSKALNSQDLIEIVKAGKLEQFQSLFQCYCLNGHIFLELGKAWLFVVSGSTDLYNGTETADFYGYLFAAARFFA